MRFDNLSELRQAVISHENWSVCANFWWLGKMTQEMCGT
jgi:hypothetical protein